MDTTIEEKIQFNSGLLKLSGVLEYPLEAPVRQATLLCSPHPHFAGNMDNNVITAVSKKLSQDAAVLRFDYRGVGQSRIDLPEGISVFDYWDDVETTKDYTDAIKDTAAAFETLAASLENSHSATILVGYSFGAAVAMKYGIDSGQTDILIGIAPPLGKVDFHFLSNCRKPCLLLIGRKDFLYSLDELNNLRSIIHDNVKIEELEDCDHFFRGDEELIAEIVRDFVLKFSINMETS